MNADPSETPYEVFLETECAVSIGDKWETINDANASKGAYMSIAKGNTSTFAPPATVSDILSFNFEVSDAGVYKIWGRVLTPGELDDSFWIRLDEGDWIKWNDIPHSDDFMWDDIHDTDQGNETVLFNLTAGVHKLDVSFREDGAGIDKLFITNTNVQPTEKGELATNCLPTCDDGIQNGDETGVDCGGSCDNACPEPFEFYLETECATAIGDNWNTIENANASNGSFMKVKPALNAWSIVPTADIDLLRYQFNITEEGNYKIWGRINTPSKEDDSFWIRVDNQNWIKWNDLPLSSGFVWDDIHDSDLDGEGIKFNFTTGLHTLEVAYREDGAGIDKFYITNTGATPGSEGDEAINCTNTCDDGIQNGDETGVDCGGSCPNDCPPVATCDDGIKNGDETGVDCGGSCPNDCPPVATCDDGIKNGDETGVDCGGSCPNDCPPVATCDDGIKNGDETGGSCPNDCPPVSNTCEINRSFYTASFTLNGNALEVNLDAPNANQALIDFGINGSEALGYWMDGGNATFTYTINNVNQGDILRFSFRIFINGAQTITNFEELTIGDCSSTSQARTVIQSLGVEEQSTEISIYPNPTDQILTVNGIEASDSYTIYTYQGLEVLSGKGSQINVSSLTNGLYILEYAGFRGIFVIQR